MGGSIGCSQYGGAPSDDLSIHRPVMMEWDMLQPWQQRIAAGDFTNCSWWYVAGLIIRIIIHRWKKV